MEQSDMWLDKYFQSFRVTKGENTTTTSKLKKRKIIPKDKHALGLQS